MRFSKTAHSSGCSASCFLTFVGCFPAPSSIPHGAFHSKEKKRQHNLEIKCKSNNNVIELVATF